MYQLNVTVEKANGTIEAFEYPFKYDNYIDAATELQRAQYILSQYGDKIQSVTITKE